MEKRGEMTSSAIIFLIILISFFSFYFVTASTLDNVKEYDEETRAIIIKDETNLKIAELKLNTPHNNYSYWGCGANCNCYFCLFKENKKKRRKN